MMKFFSVTIWLYHIWYLQQSKGMENKTQDQWVSKHYRVQIVKEATANIKVVQIL